MQKREGSRLFFFLLNSSTPRCPRWAVYRADWCSWHQRRHLSCHLWPQWPGNSHCAWLWSLGMPTVNLLWCCCISHVCVIQLLWQIKHRRKCQMDFRSLSYFSNENCVFQSNEPNETMPISAFAQKHRSTRYIQNLMTPTRAPYPAATTPVHMGLFSYM